MSNLFNIQGVINDITHKTILNFCQAYGLNRFEEQAENRNLAKRSAFWWLEINLVRDNRDMKLNPTLVKIAPSIWHNIENQ